MGFGLRFREKVKQVGKKSSQPDKHGFVPTSYERVQLTYEEAAKFAESLKIIRKRISEANHARAKVFRDVETTLTGSLPCIHEIDPETGEHNTQEAAPEGAANYVHTGTLTRLSEEQDAKIEAQVFKPIDAWISEVDLFKGKMKILENLRLELDGSRRDHVALEAKIAKAEAKATDIDPKHTTHIQSKDASVAGKRTAFEQYELQIYEELVSIIGETGVLHTALDRALKLEIDTYQRALDPISSTTARLENLSTESPPSSAIHSGPAPTAPVGAHSTGTHPTGTHPTSTHPTGTHPTGTHPTGTHPTGTRSETVYPSAPTHTVPSGPSQTLPVHTSSAQSAATVPLSNPVSVAHNKPYAS